MNKLYAILLVALLIGIMPLISAQIYQVDTNVDLKFTCTIDNRVPSSSAIFNLSIDYPNGTTMIPTTTITPKGQGLFNYTASFGSTGYYTLHEFCYDAGSSYSVSEEILITPNGTEITTAKGILYVVFLIAGVGVFLLSLYWAIKIPFKNNRSEEGSIISINDLKYFKIFLIGVTYIILLFNFGLLRSITANYLYETGVYQFFQWMYWFMLSAMYPLIVCSLIFAVIIFINDKKLHKQLERGLQIR